MNDTNANTFFDLQVNGYAGVDFNTDDLSDEQVHHACERLAVAGAGGVLATLVTDDVARMAARLERLVAVRRRDALVERVRAGGFDEVIMATNPTVEGDGTALHISNLLGELPVQITRLARGITTGSVLEFANKEILADAMSGRQKF